MKPKILIYSDCFIWGGCENVIENLLWSEELNNSFELEFAYRYSRNYEREATLRLPSQIKRHPIFQFANDTTFYKWELKRWPPLFLNLVKLPFKLLKKCGFYSVYSFVVLLITFRRIRPDIIYINNGGYPGALSARVAVFAAALIGSIKKTIFCVNNLAYPQRYKISRFVDSFINEHVDVFITASKAAKARLIQERGFNIEKCIDIPNTIRRERLESVRAKINIREEFDLPQTNILIGIVGLLTYRKGHRVLVDAVSKLAQRRRNFTVIVLGDGEEKRSLLRQIREQEVDNYILFLGHKPNVLDYMKQCDFLVLPSLENEDFPYVNIEAMALSKPLIVTDVAGMPEQVIDGVNGYVVKPGDSDALQLAINNLISNGSLKEFGENALRKYTEEYQYNKVIGRYKKVFELS